MTFQSALSEEMLERIPSDVYEYVKNSTLTKFTIQGVSREILEKRNDDGSLIYYNIQMEGTNTPIGLRTMTRLVSIIVQNWKKYLGPQMQTLIVEAAYAHAVKAKKDVSSFKAVDAAFATKETVPDDKLALSPSVTAILQAIPVGTTIVIGQGATTQGAGDQGHERLDTVHSLADGREEDIVTEMVPLGHDKSVHGVYEGGDTTERHPVFDSSVALKDTVDNNGGADLDTSE